IRWQQLPKAVGNRDLPLVLFKLPIRPRLSLGTFVGNVLVTLNWRAIFPSSIARPRLRVPRPPRPGSPRAASDPVDAGQRLQEALAVGVVSHQLSMPVDDAIH